MKERQKKTDKQRNRERLRQKEIRMRKTDMQPDWYRQTRMSERERYRERERVTQ